jgi:hypothetical protein
VTRAAASIPPAQDCGCGWPEATTPVLLHRPVLAGIDRLTLSVFAQDRWDLNPGVFEAHARAVTVSFHDCPAALRPAVKHYLWEMINHIPPRVLRKASTDQLSLRSIAHSYRRLLVFMHWLDGRGITQVGHVTDDLLNRFLDHVLTLERSSVMKADYLHEVRRLWCYRDRLPAHLQLPTTPPWGGNDNQDLLGPRRANRENATSRIHHDTLQPLLMWSLRFVEDFAPDIIVAFSEYQRLARRGHYAAHRLAPERRDHLAHTGWLTSAVDTWLADRRRHGLALPGHRKPDGTLEVSWAHLRRIFDSSHTPWFPGRPAHALVASSGLPIADDAYLDTPITGRLHDRPWLAAIAYRQAPQLARLLVAAAAIVTGYLSGMRPGELLSLERDCVEHDPVAKLWLLRGTRWKGAIDDKGRKLPEGQPRDDPWVVVEPVARAIEALQRLHPHPLLFPTRLPAYGLAHGRRRPERAITARNNATLAQDIAALIAWVNQYCADHDCAQERIPDDPHGGINLSRFRRTLAWHIVRRPRGLIAGAIQYGHLHLRITLGYSGSYASGFPDDLAYEDWLLRLEQLTEREERLVAGEHISGPGADTYHHRVHTGHAKFAGRVLANTRQARDLLDNPLLQIYPGKAMTCVFNPQQALCQIQRTEGDTRRTPDQSDCRPTCKNLAYTDTNIAELQARADQLREIVADPFAPSLRRSRERQELDRINTLIRDHQGQ